jgi:hypothetical protein
MPTVDNTYESSMMPYRKSCILPVESSDTCEGSPGDNHAASFAFHMGKAVEDVATIQIPIKRLIDVRSPKSVPS